MLFRSVHAEQAVAAVLTEIDRLGLRVDAELVGPTMRVRLLRDGTPVSLGYGKGRGAQGTVSAYAEALERYLMSARDNRRFRSHNTVLLAASTVAPSPRSPPTWSFSGGRPNFRRAGQGAVSIAGFAVLWRPLWRWPRRRASWWRSRCGRCGRRPGRP